jgi:hypothetical protein
VKYRRTPREKKKKKHKLAFEPLGLRRLPNWQSYLSLCFFY